MRRSHKTNKENLESRFDSGETVLDYFDADSVMVRVSMDFPAWMLRMLDQESTRRGVSRQALVKMWIADRFERLGTRNSSRAHRTRMPGKARQR